MGLTTPKYSDRKKKGYEDSDYSPLASLLRVITNKLLLSIVILLELVILGVLIYYKFFHKH